MIIKVGIIDYKCNNLFSISQACKEVGFQTDIVSVNQKLDNYNILILPGVGSFQIAAQYLKQNNFDQKIIEFINKKDKLIFGICLGMQLFFEKSYENGIHKGLGIIKGEVKKIKKNKNLKVPNIGWMKIQSNNKENFISKVNLNQSYYFVHSYECVPKNKSLINTFTAIKNHKFCSSIRDRNILGCQFHPEKSGKYGIKILKDLKKFV